MSGPTSQGVSRRFVSTEAASIERIRDFVRAFPWVPLDAAPGWSKFVNVHRVSEIRRVPVDLTNTAEDAPMKLVFTAVYDEPGGEAQHVEVLGELTDPKRLGLLYEQLSWLERSADAC